MSAPSDLGRARDHWLVTGLLFVALATLMLEVLDTRLFSVLTWYGG